MTQYAKFAQRSAPLSQDFGEKMARRYFGDETVDALPRYVRGQKKGLLKGRVGWKKVEEGGWVRAGVASDAGPSGRVERRSGKVIAAVLYLPEWRDEPKIVDRWSADLGDEVDVAWL